MISESTRGTEINIYHIKLWLLLKRLVLAKHALQLFNLSNWVKLTYYKVLKIKNRYYVKILENGLKKITWIKRDKISIRINHLFIEKSNKISIANTRRSKSSHQNIFSNFSNPGNIPNYIQCHYCCKGATQTVTNYSKFWMMLVVLLIKDF